MGSWDLVMYFMGTPVLSQTGSLSPSHPARASQAYLPLPSPASLGEADLEFPHARQSVPFLISEIVPAVETVWGWVT